MQFTVSALFALAAVAAAQTSNVTSSASETGCVAAFDTCRQPTNGVSANQAVCASQNAACKDKCQTAYDACRQPTNGVSANQAVCASAYETCLGEVPTRSSSAAASDSTATGSAYVGPVVIATGNYSTATGSAYVGPALVFATEVVTALTTYCPAATEITTNGKTYTVSSATTLTITDCPCTITKSASASMATATASGNGTMSATSTVAVFTGAASREIVGAGSFVAALGSFFFLF